MNVYNPQGYIEAADCVIGHSFGSSIDEASVNRELAEQMMGFSEGRPMIADRTLVDALPNCEPLMAHIVQGEATNIKMEGVGTWGTLTSAKEYMSEHGLSSPLMVAQAYHVERVARQAAKLGIVSIIPEALPVRFDKNSDQIWTRSAFLWITFNKIGSLVLKKRGQL